MTLHTPRRVEKPWGWELHWADTELYLGKILHVNAGEALSLQYHEEKDETFYLLAGEVTLVVGPDADTLEEITMRANDACRVRPGVVHRMVAVTECEILEASTPHPDDIVRLEDRYGRDSDDA
ncbi:MAG: cupin domain-containing protein [Longimicrobiales bacterium]|nr:cupin domain-containing protein [Longimicrobiales bacterium]